METRRGGNGRGDPKPPPWASRPEMRRYSRPAQAALWRQDLLRGAWVDRLMQADDRFVRFVNRFYHVPGFHYVVRDYFDGRYKQNIAQMAMRLAARLREREGALRFARSLVFVPGGGPVRGIKLVRNNTHYVLNPWPRISETNIRPLLRRSTALYQAPQHVRWVFDKTQLQMPKQAVVAAVRRALARSVSDRDRGDRRAWLNAAGRLVVVV